MGFYLNKSIRLVKTVTFPKMEVDGKLDSFTIQNYEQTSVVIEQSKSDKSAHQTIKNAVEALNDGESICHEILVEGLEEHSLREALAKGFIHHTIMPEQDKVLMSFTPGDDSCMPSDGNIEGATLTIETTHVVNGSATKKIKKFRCEYTGCQR